MRLNNCLLAAAVGVALALPSIDAADATPVNYTFSVTAGDGPLAGTTAAGTFSYDTSSIVLNGTNPSTGLLTALNFTWDGITYSQTTANTGLLQFGATGMLTRSLFGTNCVPGDCAVTFGQEQWRFFFPIVFDYTVQGLGGVLRGNRDREPGHRGSRAPVPRAARCCCCGARHGGGSAKATPRLIGVERAASPDWISRRCRGRDRGSVRCG